jgi:uncharacterized protein (DUF433 family)
MQGIVMSVATVTENNIFLEGLYTRDQAAHLARLSTRSLQRWLDGDADTEPVLLRKMPVSDSKVIGFVDLIQALAIRAIRNSGKLSLQKVRQTITEAARLGVSFPFARHHQTYVFDDDVVIKLADETLIQVTGRYRHQQLIKPVVELYLEDLSFDATTGLAAEFVPLRDTHGDVRIVINPKRKYGSPLVMPRGRTVNSLVMAVDSEGSIAAAAHMCEVPEGDVKLALRYEDILAGIAA